MRKFIARRNKTAVVREPVCPQSHEKRSLCAHCRHNPLVPIHEDLAVVVVIDATMPGHCTLSRSHGILPGAAIGLAYTISGLERLGWVCPMCVAGLPFHPKPELNDEPQPERVVSELGMPRWVSEPALRRR